MAPSNFQDHEECLSPEAGTDSQAIDERLEVLLKEGSSTPADEDVESLELPEYFDPELFRLGQDLFYKNVFSMMIAKLSGLLTLLAVPSILEILIHTKQSGTPCTAFRRYTSTVLHTFLWYKKDPYKEVEFFESLHYVRKKHCIISRRCSEAGLRRISQLDMALTQFGFVGFSILSGDELGLYATAEELEGLVHFWRVIGCLLGMEERYNLCTGSTAECRALCRRLLDEVFLPHFAIKNKNFDLMGRILIEGLWPINPYLDPEAFIAFTFHLAISAATNNNHSIVIDTLKMPIYSKLMLDSQLKVHHYLLPPSYWWSPIFRGFFNSLMRLAIFLTENCPFLAYWRYGKKQSYVNIYKFHYD